MCVYTLQISRQKEECLPRGNHTHALIPHPLHMFQQEAHMQNHHRKAKHLRHGALAPSGEADNDAIHMNRTLSD